MGPNTHHHAEEMAACSCYYARPSAVTLLPKWLPEVHSPGHILQGPSSPAHDSSERGHKTLGYMGHVRIGPVGVSPTYSHPKPAIQSGHPPSLHSLQTMTVATAGHTILSTQRGLSPSYIAEGLKMGGEDRETDGVPQAAHKTGQSTAVARKAVQMPAGSIQKGHLPPERRFCSRCQQ